MKSKEKMYIVRKYVLAKDVSDAVRKEKKTGVSEVFIDDDWRKNKTDNLASAIGFGVERKEDD